MNPDHWLDAAKRLLEQPRRGAPRQVDLRCAVSLIYYALFHWLTAFLAMANRVIRGLEGATPAEKRALAIHVLFRERSV